MQRDQRPRQAARTARERARRALAAAALLLVALLLGPAAGCGDDPPATEPEVLTVRSAGADRTAVVVPGDASEEGPAPLVLAFHGSGSSGSELLAALTTFPERSGATVVLPDAMPCGSAPGGGACWPAESDARGAKQEAAFVERLVEAVAGRWPVDRERVYALGLSNGGAWTIRLLLDRPDLVRGGIAIAGYDPTRAYARLPDGALAVPLTPVTPTSIPRPARARPLVIEHGTADEVVPYPLGLELFRTMIERGWPEATTLFQPIVGLRHLDPQLLGARILTFNLQFVDERSVDPPEGTTSPATATAPSGATG